MWLKCFSIAVSPSKVNYCYLGDRDTSAAVILCAKTERSSVVPFLRIFGLMGSRARTWWTRSESEARMYCAHPFALKASDVCLWTYVAAGDARCRPGGRAIRFHAPPLASRHDWSRLAGDAARAVSLRSAHLSATVVRGKPSLPPCSLCPCAKMGLAASSLPSRVALAARKVDLR